MRRREGWHRATSMHPAIAHLVGVGRVRYKDKAGRVGRREGVSPDILRFFCKGVCYNWPTTCNEVAGKAVMAMQTLTIELPDDLYAKLRDRARSSRRSVEEALTDLLVDALPGKSTLPRHLDAAIAPLALLDDEALRQAARTSVPADVVSELEGLHLQRQREGLSDREAARGAMLLRHYGRTMLVRAEAARLLHERGRDVSSLLIRRWRKPTSRKRSERALWLLSEPRSGCR